MQLLARSSGLPTTAALDGRALEGAGYSLPHNTDAALLPCKNTCAI